MNQEKARSSVFTRRAALLGGGQALLLSALVGRMYQLQIVEADRYRDLSEDNRISVRLLEPLRGRILDRFGISLAENDHELPSRSHSREGGRTRCRCWRRSHGLSR